MSWKDDAVEHRDGSGHCHGGCDCYGADDTRVEDTKHRHQAQTDGGLCLCFSTSHLAKLNGVVSGDHLGFAYIAPIIYLQVELSWSLISTSIPSLRAFLQPLEPQAVPKGTVITAINPVQTFSRRLSAWSGSITAKSERWSDDLESARPQRQRMTAVTTVQGNIRRLGSVPEDLEPPSSTLDWGQIRRDDTWEIQCRRASEITLAGG
ncbi:hypothetical protein M8818_005887 [Zalaria obscura]|uniref:Uncharacterized protein n=1 Tax=Zalaria obscura TaxID=2024903 RepID=A0ACC3S861_9PEZI